MRLSINPFKCLTDTNTAMFDNTNRLARIRYRFHAYGKTIWKSLMKGIPLAEIIGMQFPRAFQETRKPPRLYIELTNICDLKCTYCPNHLNLRPQAFMNNETLNNIIKNLKQMNINRIDVVGNGEPTCHPQFGTFIEQLSKSTKLLTLTTNGQWRKEQLIYDMLPVDIIFVSVEGNDQTSYERSRKGGDFTRLINNLRTLQKIKREENKKTLVVAALMIRPSNVAKKEEFIRYWRYYVDVVMPQYVISLQEMGHVDDVFQSMQYLHNLYPICAKIFKDFCIFVNGEVPLCGALEHRGESFKTYVGNIKDTPLVELWDSPLKRQYRYAHRRRLLNDIPLCKGCQGG